MNLPASWRAAIILGLLAILLACAIAIVTTPHTPTDIQLVTL